MRIPHLKRWVLRFQPIWWLTFVFTFSRLPRHFKKEFYTIFNSLGCAESKDNKIFILGLELVNVLPKVYIGITFVQIECNLVIICYKVNLLYIIPPILILEYKYCYFLILLRLDCWELYKTIILNETSLFTILNMVFSFYSFVNNFSNFIHGINICCYSWILQRLGCWKTYRTSFQDVLEAEKWAKQKPVLFFETPCTFIVQWCWKWKFRSYIIIL